MLKPKIWIIILLFQSLSAKEQTITTIAGKYIPAFNGYGGDGGPAINALLSQPINICTDGKNNLYISDRLNNVIRKINSLGIITTYAGTSIAGYAGDGGNAKKAQLNGPSCVAEDKKGNLYIADTYNHVVRKINSQGVITTFAGTGSSGYSGDGGLAVNAQLDEPSGIAIDNDGNVFISDFNVNAIRRIDTFGVIQTIAGNNTAGYYGDGGSALQAHIWNVCLMRFDNKGDLYFADRFNNVVRKINMRTGIIETVAGTGVIGIGGDGGLALNARLNAPYDICFDSLNNIYISDSHNNRIRKVDAAGIITTIAGTGQQGYSGDGRSPLQAQLGVPCGILIDNNGDLEIVEPANNTVRKLSICKKTNLQFSIDASSTNVCQGTPVTFKVEGAELTNTTHYQWFVDGISQKSSGNSFMDTFSKSCTVNCIVFQDCFQDSLITGVAVNVLPKPQVQIVANSTWIYANDTIQLKGSITGSYSHFWWTPTLLMQGSQSLAPSVSPKQTTTYTLSATSDKCESNAEIQIKVVYPFRMPTSFTPNGDNLNDLFRIPPNCFVNLLKFSVFDRWGNILFTTEDLNTGWNGSFKGKPCPTGTYVYLILIRDRDKKAVYSGTVTLLR